MSASTLPMTAKFAATLQRLTVGTARRQAFGNTRFNRPIRPVRRDLSQKSKRKQLDDGRRHTAGNQSDPATRQQSHQVSGGHSYSQSRDTGFCLASHLERPLSRHFCVTVDSVAKLADGNIHGGKLRYDKAAGFEPAYILFCVLHWSLRSLLLGQDG